MKISKNINETDFESLVKIASQFPVGSKFEDNFLLIERLDPYHFIINVKADREEYKDESESIESVLFG